MKKIISLILALALLFGAVLSLSSCEAMAAVLFEMLTLGGNRETDDGEDENADEKKDETDEGDGEQLVLDPDAIDEPFSDEVFDSLFGVEWQTLPRDTERNSELAQLMKDSYFLGYDYYQYQHYRRHTYYTETEAGEVLGERHGETATISFYTGVENYSRQYYESNDITDGYHTVTYTDERDGRGFTRENDLGVEREYPFFDSDITDTSPIDYSDSFQYTLFPEQVTSYGYAEENGCYYFHIEVTMPLAHLSGRVARVNRYYRLDSDYNITAYYSYIECRYWTTYGDEYSRDVVEVICMPYDSYFDMPLEAYDI